MGKCWEDLGENFEAQKISHGFFFLEKIFRNIEKNLGFLESRKNPGGFGGLRLIRGSCDDPQKIPFFAPKKEGEDAGGGGALAGRRGRVDRAQPGPAEGEGAGREKGGKGPPKSLETPKSQKKPKPLLISVQKRRLYPNFSRFYSKNLDFLEDFFGLFST